MDAINQPAAAPPGAPEPTARGSHFRVQENGRTIAEWSESELDTVPVHSITKMACIEAKWQNAVEELAREKELHREIRYLAEEQAAELSLLRSQRAEDAERIANSARVIEGLSLDRLTLARLAAPSPQFSNPLDAMEAFLLRDRILGVRDTFPSSTASHD